MTDSQGRSACGPASFTRPQVLIPRRPLHRLAEVRQQQGISRRTVARHLGIEPSRVKLQEQPTSDLLISTLLAWQQVLDVPAGELFVEADDQLAPPVLRRTQLLRMMKTVLAIGETTNEEPIRRMVETLVQQLLEVMPELDGVSAWHSIGQRRSRDELGIAASRRLGEDVFVDLVD
ncbi:MAG: helix-turn-helix domain-containing protein [Planctomycetota bacterium]